MVGTGHAVLLGLDALALVGALGITVISLRAYRETGSPTYRSAFIGFAFLTAGVASEAILFRFGGLQLLTIHTIETALFLAGFAGLYRSLQ